MGMFLFRQRGVPRVSFMEQSSISKFFGSSITKKAKTIDDAEANSNLPQDVEITKPVEIDVPETSLYHVLHDNTWKNLLAQEFTKPYFKKLEAFVEKEMQEKKVFPPREKIFNALDHTPLHKLSIVILGQDPYHAPGQAMGLSFSVPRGVQVPSSLKNI